LRGLVTLRILCTSTHAAAAGTFTHYGNFSSIGWIGRGMCSENVSFTS
jgi:hypothetical protein